MGSYLSIVNDTPYPYYVKLGADQAALKIVGTVGATVTAAAAVVASAGVAGPVAATLAANGFVTVCGVSTATVVTVAEAAVSVASVASIVGHKVSSISHSIAKSVTGDLLDSGFVLIPPGQSHRFGKMALSLWQQATCVKTTILDDGTVRTETVYMRPIFSGPTINSDRSHEIQRWVDRKGHHTQDVHPHLIPDMPQEMLEQLRAKEIEKQRAQEIELKKLQRKQAAKTTIAKLGLVMCLTILFMYFVHVVMRSMLEAIVDRFSRLFSVMRM